MVPETPKKSFPPRASPPLFPVSGMPFTGHWCLHLYQTKSSVKVISSWKPPAVSDWSDSPLFVLTVLYLLFVLFIVKIKQIDVIIGLMSAPPARLSFPRGYGWRLGLLCLPLCPQSWTHVFYSTANYWNEWMNKWINDKFYKHWDVHKSCIGYCVTVNYNKGTCHIWTRQGQVNTFSWIGRETTLAFPSHLSHSLPMWCLKVSGQWLLSNSSKTPRGAYSRPRLSNMEPLVTCTHLSLQWLKFNNINNSVPQSY